jgi:alpha-1,6-mannosyltransferase
MIKRFEERWKFNCSAFLFVLTLLSIGFIDRQYYWVLFSVYFLSFTAFIGVIRNYESTKELFILLGILALGGLFFMPELSNDYNRFLWDGEWATRGVNPYDHLPAELLRRSEYTQSTYLHELYTNMGALSQNNYSCYPPLTQVFFAIAAFFSESSLGGIIFLRILFAGTLALALHFAVKFFKLNQGLGTSIWLLFLNPLFITEVYFNLHFEGMMIAFLLIAFGFLLTQRLALGSLLFAAAVQIKLVPLLLLPFFWRFYAWKKALTIYAFVGLAVFLLFMPLVDLSNYRHFLESLSLYFRVFEFNSFILYYYLEYGYWKLGWNATLFYGPRLARIAIQFIVVLALYGEFSDQKTLFKRMTIAYFTYLLLSSTLHPWYILPLLMLSIYTNYLFPLVWSFTVFLSYTFYFQGNNASSNELILWLEYLPVLLVFGYELYAGGIRDRWMYSGQSRFGTGS